MSKIMLVCSTPSAQVEKCLRTTGGEIVTVNNGEAAIIKAQHATFNMAVLVSTGKTMDLAETVFNLRDINSSMPILIIDERHGAQESQAQIIAHASPNTQAVTVHGLASYLGVSESSARRNIGKKQ
jgi:DNA-binding response OmpR family regulator